MKKRNFTYKYYGLHSETKRYLKELSRYNRYLEKSDIIDIDNFIKGLSNLNLLESCVCWPLRSIHNIGSGSTIASIGQNNIYKGTLINSPAWSNTGIIKSANNQYINFTNNKFLLTARSIFGAWKYTLTTNLWTVPYEANAGGGDRTWWSTAHNYVDGNNNVNISTTRNGVMVNTQVSIINRRDMYNLTGATYLDNKTISSSNGNCTVTNNQALRNPNPSIQGYPTITMGRSGTAERGEWSIYMLFFKDLSVTEHLNLYGLYKNTLGKGLDLL